MRCPVLAVDSCDPGWFTPAVLDRGETGSEEPEPPASAKSRRLLLRWLGILAIVSGAVVAMIVAFRWDDYLRLVSRGRLWTLIAICVFSIAVGWVAWRTSRHEAVSAARWWTTLACHSCRRWRAGGDDRRLPRGTDQRRWSPTKLRPVWFLRVQPMTFLGGLAMVGGELIVSGSTASGCDAHPIVLRLDPVDGDVLGRSSAEVPFGPVAAG